MSKAVLLVAVSAAIGAASVARADTVMLKDGSQLKGTVIETVEGDHLVLQTESGAKEVVPWSEVKRVIASPASPTTDKVVLKDGTAVEGKVVEQKEGEYVVIVTSSGGKETIPWSEMKRVVLAPGSQPTTTVAPTTTASAAAPAEVAAPGEPSGAPAGVRRHDGFYFRAGLGAAFIADGNVRTPVAGPLVNMGGGAVAVELAFGGTLANGLVLGGGIYGASIPTPSYSAAGKSVDGGAAVISTVGPFADWYIDPTWGLHFQASIGYAVISAGEGSDPSLKFPPKDQSGGGYSLLAGAGYEWWVGDQLSFGVLARLHYVNGSVKGSGDSASSDVWVLMPAILATLTYH
jgi:hypothetical protein